MNRRFLSGSAAIALVVGLALAAPARADDQATPAPPPPPPHPVFGPVMVSGHIDAGTNINPDSPDNNINFGQLGSDRADSFSVYQTWLGVEKDIDSSSTGLDWGFKAQAFYGTDARYTHVTGIFDRATSSPYQWSIMSLNGQAHLPFIAAGGIDVTAGVYPTPIGYEVVDATGNFFLTHSYIYNFANPVAHTGILTTSHLSDMFDLWLSVDTGVNEGLPMRPELYNGGGGLLGGIGINNPIPNLTILALSHWGPGNGYREGFSNTYCDVPKAGVESNYTSLSCSAEFGAGARAIDPNDAGREYYDIVTTYKINDAWSVANELNAIHDDMFHASAEGGSVYGVYTFNDQWSFGGRGEIFRDDEGFFVGAFQESLAADNAMRGLITNNTGGPTAYNSSYNAGKATYSELTLGANYKPPLPALPLNAGLTLRPEIRWDHAWGLNPGEHPFDVTKASAAGGIMNGTKDDQVLFSVDAVFGF